jgi:ADP-ribosylglycohydrolase
MALSANPADRLQRARESLEGLSVGDGFGEQFFHVFNALNFVVHRAIPLEQWFFTDDTNMALSIYATLRQCGKIDQDKLAISFAEHYHPGLGYGPVMHRLLAWIRTKVPWRVAASQLFEGQGSYGNGAAMRNAPLGGTSPTISIWWSSRRDCRLRSHAHPEGIAGGIAVAVAAAIAARLRGEPAPSRREFIDLILPHVPDSVVREKVRHARELAPGSSLQLAVSALGNGSQISAQDTVAFCLWCAGEQLANYQEALWLTASGMGDVDTTCAIVGGIVAAYTGIEGIPAEWVQAREPLPEWAFNEIL